MKSVVSKASIRKDNRISLDDKVSGVEGFDHHGSVSLSAVKAYKARSIN